MNSEISNVSKPSPVTVVKAEQKLPNTASGSAPKPTAEIANGLESADIVPKTDGDRPDSKPSLDVVKRAADEGNNLLQSVKRNLQFTVDDSTKELVVKIVDSDSGELVRQIPSEEMLAFIARLQELDGEGHLGNMFQERA